MKDIKVATVKDEEPKDLYIFFNKSLQLSYEEFLLKHFKHPKFRKELFFLLKTTDDKLISMFANRDTSIFNSDLNVALFGDVATLYEYRRKGCMKFLLKYMLRKLQEEKDMIINPWTGRETYQKVYSKLGFSRIKKLKTTYKFYKDVSLEKKINIFNFHDSRMRDRKTKQRRQIIFTLILYIQYLCLLGVHIFRRLSLKTCNIEKLGELKEDDIKKINEFFIEYASKQARIFFERDGETWRFIYSYNDIYLIKHNGENVGYAIGSFSKDSFVIKEIFAKDSGIYFYAMSYFEEVAQRRGKREIMVWADTLHRSLVRYGYIPCDITFIMPFDPRGVTVVVRMLKNFFEKMSVDCKLHLYDPLLDSHVDIGKGDFSINLMQKDMADLVFGGSTIFTLFKAEVRPKYKIFNAYGLLSRIKKEYGIEDCLRTRFDTY